MKCLIFDMDATLIDSSKAITTTINNIRAGVFGREALGEGEILDIINDPKKNAVYEFYGIESSTKNMRFVFEDEFAKNYDLFARPFDEAMELVAWAKSRGWLVALATNAPQHTAVRVLERCGVLDAFDLVVGESEGVELKPAPDMLFLVERKLGCEAVFLGDSAKDFLAAVNAKMPYVNVNWGRAETNGDYNCKTTAEAKSAIEKIFGVAER